MKRGWTFSATRGSYRPPSSMKMESREAGGISDGKLLLNERDDSTQKLKNWQMNELQSTGTDPSNYQAKRDQSEPQSWNAYTYVNNRPLSRVDPDGRGFLERLKNLWNGFGFRTNAQVEEETIRKRAQLIELEERAGGNGALPIFEPVIGSYVLVEPRALTQHQVWFWAAVVDDNFRHGGQ